jgi:hypothetical protein
MRSPPCFTLSSASSRLRRRAAVLACLAACLAPIGAPAATTPARGHDQRCDRAIEAKAFARTELFFGLSRPGGVVSETEFQVFIDTQVTPRFPQGLTLLSGAGQFRDASGKTVIEGSKLLVLLYPRRDRDANAKIESIRREYRYRFEQQSVLRSDETSCVSL